MIHLSPNLIKACQNVVIRLEKPPYDDGASHNKPSKSAAASAGAN
jgi:hypothetical protein